MAVKSLDLRFPFAGVVRRAGFHASADFRGPFPTPWAVNVRAEDPIARRLRGGSRPGLTKFLTSPAGTSIAGMAAVQVASTTGTEELLVVLVDETLGVVSDGVLSFPVGALQDESGNYFVTEAGDRILLSTTDAPASAFLVVGQQHAYAIAASAIVKLDPKSGMVTDLTAKRGTLPTGCTLGAVYRDRLALAGGDNAVYLSRQGDFTDWDYGARASDPGRAIPFQLSGASQVGDACTALVAHQDSFLLASTKRSLWIVRGDPVAGGGLQEVSRFVGVIDPRAWCQVNGIVFFLAEDGLYLVGADGSGLRNESDGLPQELRDIDTSSTAVLLGYDHQATGLHIYLPTADGGDTHWFYDLAAKAFWPMRLAADHAPAAICRYQGNLLLAGTDGYLRSVGGDDDDGTDIESHVLFGPFRLSGPNEFGMLLNLHGITATGSGTVNWRLVTGDTAEEASASGKAAIEAFQAGSDYASYVKASGAWTAGRSHRVYPRVRAMWACLWLQSTAKWAYEAAAMETTPFGRWR